MFMAYRWTKDFLFTACVCVGLTPWWQAVVTWQYPMPGLRWA